MFRMMLMLFPVIATVLMGSAVVAVLTMDMWSTWQPVALAALAGFVLAIPVSWFVGKQVVANTA